MQVEIKYKHTITGQYIKEKVPCLEIGETRNVRGRTSDGNWGVDYVVPIPLGDGKHRCVKYFWRKKEAVSWINHIKTS